MGYVYVITRRGDGGVGCGGGLESDRWFSLATYP